MSRICSVRRYLLQKPRGTTAFVIANSSSVSTPSRCNWPNSRRRRSSTSWCPEAGGRAGAGRERWAYALCWNSPSQVNTARRTSPVLTRPSGHGPGGVGHNSLSSHGSCTAVFPGSGRPTVVGSREGGRRAWRCARRDRAARTRECTRMRGRIRAGTPGGRRVGMRAATAVLMEAGAPAATARTGRVKGIGGPSPRSCAGARSSRPGRGCRPRWPTPPRLPGSGSPRNSRSPPNSSPSAAGPRARPG